MSAAKLNVLHWHLTDDQAFSFVPQGVPELGERGALAPSLAYSRRDVAGVVAYARDRGVRVVPEFDVPGHAASWGKSHPEILTQCCDARGEVTGVTGPLDPSQPETFALLWKLLRKQVELFPDPYVHVGGDEVDVQCWESSPRVRAWMETEGLNATDIQPYFLDRVTRLAASAGKQPMAWQEAFDSDAKSSILSSTIVQGHLAVLSAPWYLNLGTYAAEDWKRYYAVDPAPQSLSRPDLVLGGEACVWGEFVDETNVIQKTWPAAAAVAECGHVDSGKSTTTGRLLFELGGIPERELEKLKEEAAALGKSSFAFAFYMDRQKEERERGVTISCTTKEFFTNNWHYTIIDAPGHRDFIKNMISGAAQADVCLLMVPADGNFTTAIQKGDHKAGEIQGQTRQHARLLNLLGVKQLIVGVNKMDSDVAKYSQARYDEIATEMRHMLVRVGWKGDFVEKSVPVIPISGWMGDNLITKSTNMTWWEGKEVLVGTSEKVKVHTLLDALNEMVRMPDRKKDAPVRVPISGIYKIKGVGDVLAGRVEQGVLKPNEEVVFMPTHTAANPCTGKVFTIEMHHKRADAAGPGDNVGMNIKGLDKNNLPRTGDVMILKSDATLRPVKDFTAQIQTLDIPGEVKAGYSPIGFVRCGRAACRITKINWKVGKETGGKKLEEPHSLKANEMAEVVFEPCQPLVVDSFKSCEGLSRIAFLDGNTAVMLGKVVSTTSK
ncbi:glycosyl hydrolase [Helicosporidium sp. ATCC 50920]|nr:glycosyl hydrolase [Helicosporidium sp. ATCC 50920]|eukprot:KDD76122.1 glycosyl hydrolase [Helicosporidium sp. ATCC 50920]